MVNETAVVPIAMSNSIICCCYCFFLSFIDNIECELQMDIMAEIESNGTMYITITYTCSRSRTRNHMQKQTFYECLSWL